MMINGEIVKQSIISKLLEIAPNISVYKEASSNIVYPHFFVYQISVSDELERNKHHILDYSMEIRYRTASDSSTDLRLEKNLDEVGLKLLQNFNIINFGDRKIKCSNKSIEKIDGALHLFFNIKIMCEEVSEDKNKKLNKLDLEVNIQ